MDKRDVLIWLNSLRDIGNKTIGRLESYFGDISYLWDSSNKEILEINWLNDKIKNKIINSKNLTYYENVKENIKKMGVRVITVYDNEYPKILKDIYNSPKVLYINGEIKKEDQLSIAIVGSRKATPYGRWAAEKISKELSQLGITIISGMAKGIDTIAHNTALKENGRTIAVLGCGIDVIYPKSNKELYHEIIKNGAVISEFPPATVPMPRNFPQRNRIISGLALGVVVIEASKKSGSLITAHHGMEQGKEVFALPGNINSIYSKGTNLLIKDGAKMIMGIEDILEEINELKHKLSNLKENKLVETGLSNTEKEIINCIKEKPVHSDMISYITGINISTINSVLTVLEMKGLVKQLPGRIYTII